MILLQEDAWDFVRRTYRNDYQLLKNLMIKKLLSSLEGSYLILEGLEIVLYFQQLKRRPENKLWKLWNKPKIFWFYDLYVFYSWSVLLR